jgi:hypothetical protein
MMNLYELYIEVERRERRQTQQKKRKRGPSQTRAYTAKYCPNTDFAKIIIYGIIYISPQHNKQQRVIFQYS